MMSETVDESGLLVCPISLCCTVSRSSRLQTLFIDTSLSLMAKAICTISDIDQPGPLPPTWTLKGRCKALKFQSPMGP